MGAAEAGDPLTPLAAAARAGRDLGADPHLLQRVGSACWSIVGVVVVLTILTVALSAVSEVVLPLLFGIVLSVLFAGTGRSIQRRGVRPALASMIVVVGLIAVTAGAVLVAITAIFDQGDTWSDNVDRAAEEAEESLGVGAESIEEAREAVAGLRAFVTHGFVTELLSGIGTVMGFLAGSVLAAVIMYYLLKDGTAVRARVVTWFPVPARADVDALVTRSARTIRAYGAARTVLSAAVALVVTGWSALLGLPMLATVFVINFFGGYVPYIGAIVGGAVPVVLALSHLGVGAAVATIVVVMATNLALENFVEPHVMGKRLDIHPLTVLLVTTAGGILGGIVGLILAVPLTIVGIDAVTTFGRYVRQRARAALGPTEASS